MRPPAILILLAESDRMVLIPCMFKRACLLLSGLLLPVAGEAQAPKTAQAAPVIDYAARVKSVETLKEHITQREERFEAVRMDLRGLDGRTEKEIARIINNLSSLTDSRESKFRVAMVKEDVIEGLVKTIHRYRQLRMEVFERLRRNPNEPKEQLEREIAIFDERVNKRIEQVMQIVKSFPGHRDVAKYQSDGSSYWNGWSSENTRISDEWRQNNRDSNRGESERKDILKQIEKGIQAHEYRRANITDNLRTRKLSDHERAVQQEELGRIDANIDNLKQRRRELALPEGGATRTIGRDEAQDAENMLDDTRADLSRDFQDILRKFGELDREGVKIHGLKENLKAREEWLQNNPPPKPEETQPAKTE